MIRYISALNIVCLYIIYLAGKLSPHPLKPIDGVIGYLALAVTGITVLFAVVALIRWRELDAW